MAFPTATKAAARTASTIMEFNTLSPLRCPGGSPKAFTVRYRNAPAYSITARTWTDTPVFANPLRPFFERRWEERTEPFWWSTITFKTIRPARTIRSHTSRKLRTAFTESLKRKGYGPDGNRLPGIEGPPLTGSAQLNPTEAILKTRMKDLLLETDAVVEGILDSQGGRKGQGKTHINKPGQKFRGPKGENQPRDNRTTFTITKKRM